MAAKKQSKAPVVSRPRYVVMMVNRRKSPNLKPIVVYPKGESPTCDTIGEASERLSRLRASIEATPADMPYEGWKVSRIESIGVYDDSSQAAIHSHTFAPRQTISAAA